MTVSTKATTVTVRDPGRYSRIEAFSMCPASKAAVAEVLAGAGLRVLRCKRGGLLIEGKGQRFRLTDEPDAPALTVRRVVSLGMPVVSAGAA